MLINQGQRRSSNLGFPTLHAEQQRNTFIADIYRRHFADTIHRQHRRMGRYISACRDIGRALTATFESRRLYQARNSGFLNHQSQKAYDNTEIYFVVYFIFHSRKKSIIKLHFIVAKLTQIVNIVGALVVISQIKAWLRLTHDFRWLSESTSSVQARPPKSIFSRKAWFKTLLNEELDASTHQVSSSTTTALLELPYRITWGYTFVAKHQIPE